MKNLLLLSLLFVGSFVYAQDVLLFDDTQESTIVYRYQRLNGPSAAVLRQVFQAMETTQQNAAFDLSYTYQARIIEEQARLKVCVNWEELSVSRAPQLRGFNFSDLLLPTGVRYELQLFAGDELIATEQVQQDLRNKPASYISAYGEVEGGVYYTLKLKKIQFQYTNRTLAQVQNRKKAIKQYQVASDELLPIRQRLAVFASEIPQPQELPRLKQELESMSATVGRIGSAPFWQELPLRGPNAYDPNHLVSHHRSCEVQLPQLRNWLKTQQANIHVLYYEQGVQLFKQGREQEAYDAFCASLRANDCYAPSHYFVAYYDFAAGKVPVAAQRLQKVINQYNPDPATQADAYQLARGIVSFYLDAGQAAVAQRDYPGGVVFYQEALGFSQSLQGFQFGQAEAASRIQEAYTFDFQDRIDRTIALEQSGQHVVALTELEKTMAFQQEFGVISNFDTRALAAQIVNNIFRNQLADVRRYRQAGEWEEGLKVVANTAQLLQDYPGLVPNANELTEERQLLLRGKYDELYTIAANSIAADKLDQALQQAQVAARFAQQENLTIGTQSDIQIARIQRLRYQRFVGGGDQAKNSGQYQIALEQYNEAQQLEVQLAYLDASAVLQEKVSLTAVLAAEQMYTALMNKAANDNAALRTGQQQIQQLAGRYQVAGHVRVQALIGQLEEQQCINTRDHLLPEQERLLVQQQSAGDFIAARTHLNNIVSLLEQYPNCGLSDASVQLHGAIVSACAAYQETLQAAERAESQLRYGYAIEQYVAAADLYQNPSVQARLRGHDAFRLYSYLSDHPDYRMTLAGGHYLLGQKQNEQALDLLNLVLDQGVTPKDTEHLQIRLGSALAIQHFVVSADWKTAYYGFVSKEERKPYREMYKAFRKQWKRMG